MLLAHPTTSPSFSAWPRHIGSRFSRSPGTPGEGRGEGLLPSCCCTVPSCPTSRAFSLIELLVVIAVMVLILALAVPLFNVMTASRSTESAQNQIGGMLGAARAQAMALRQNAGLMIFIDPATQNTSLALVTQEPSGPRLAMVTEQDIVKLPTGISAQLINGAVAWIDGYDYRVGDIVGCAGQVYRCTTAHTSSSANRPGTGSWVLTSPDRYVGQGVIMFDGRGQLVSVPYRIDAICPLSQAIGLPSVLGTYYPAQTAYSQFGLVLFNREAFLNAGGTPRVDPQLDGAPYDAIEQAEEDWLDANSVPLLVNRYNGTLIKGE